MDTIDQASLYRNRIRRLFSLDDFGTGYSSLTYLTELDTVEVKLDRSFVRSSLVRPNDLVIIKSTIELCKMIDRDIVGEGVETIIHGKLLQILGCNHIQGEAIAMPMPGEVIIPWIKSWELAPEWKKNRFTNEELKELIDGLIQHYIAFRRVQRYVAHNQIVLPDLSLQACPIEKWIMKHKEGFKDKETFNTIYDLHKKQHILTNKVVQLTDENQDIKAHKQFKELDDLRILNLKNLIIGVLSP